MRDRGTLTGEGIRLLLSSNVRRIRQTAGLSVWDVAGRGGIGVRQWQRIEAGEVNVRLETLAKVAAGLDVDVWELFRDPSRKR